MYHPKAQLVFKYRKHSHPSIIKRYYTDVETVGRTIANTYTSNMMAFKEQIDKEFSEIYGRPVAFKKSLSSEIIIRFKQFMQQFGKNPSQVAKEIKQYLGYECSFFRKDGDKIIPIEGERIKKAYELVLSGSPFIDVENTLYS